MAEGTRIELGHAMITMVEPHKGPLAEYNRWYERDHAYSGVMVGPWAFSFSRWVATRDLKPLRYPADGPIAQPVELGSFIALYFLLAGKVDEWWAWSGPATVALGAEGRMNPDRDHISTALYDFVGAVGRGPRPVPPELANDHRYDGLVAVWTDRNPDTTIEELAAWCRDELHPSVVTDDGPVGQVLTFATRDFPGMPAGVPPTPGKGDRLLHIYLLDEDPRASWSERFAGLGERVAAAGLGTVALAAPFIPTVPGTDTYLDQLW
jgi:hypothetical protein